MIRLIGGSSRCGKSTLASQCAPLIHGQIVAGDGILRGLKSLTRSEDFPEPFPKKEMSNNRTVQRRLDWVRSRDKESWVFYRGYLEAAASRSDDDVLIEGNIWPDFITELQLPHRAVFMVDTSSKHVERLIKIRDSNSKKNNWQQNLTDEQIKYSAELNLARSRLIVHLCKKHKYPFFDLKNGEMGSVLRSARKSIMQP